MYKNIVNPKTNRKVKINSKRGKQILNRFLYELEGGSGPHYPIRKMHHTTGLYKGKCHLRDFIINLYKNDIIFNPTEKNCFLRGTFIFEDNNSEIFSFLNHPKCNTISSFWKNTHSLARKKRDVVASFKRKDLLPSKWDNKKKKGFLEKFHQYEHVLVPKLDHLCDLEECNIPLDNSMAYCSEISDQKGVLLMYHFKTITDRKYTLLKLEGEFSMSIQHGLNALKRYVEKKDHESKIYGSRREDCCKNNNCDFSTCYPDDKFGYSYNSKLGDSHIHRFIGNIQNSNIDVNTINNIIRDINSSVEYYNRNIRTGDEFFFPQYMTDDLLKLHYRGDRYRGPLKPL